MIFELILMNEERKTYLSRKYFKIISFKILKE